MDYQEQVDIGQNMNAEMELLVRKSGSGQASWKTKIVGVGCCLQAVCNYFLYAFLDNTFLNSGDGLTLLYWLMNSSPSKWALPPSLACGNCSLSGL